MKEKVQILADKIRPLLTLIDAFVNDLDEEDINLLEKSRETLLNHINTQHSAMTLTMAFGINTDTTEEEYKAKTLRNLIDLINVRKEYKNAMLDKLEQQKNIQKNREELMQIFGNM